MARPSGNPRSDPATGSFWFWTVFCAGAQHAAVTILPWAPPAVRAPFPLGAPLRFPHFYPPHMPPAMPLPPSCMPLPMPIPPCAHVCPSSSRPLVMLPPAYPQAFPCHALGPPPPCASPDNAKRQALAAPARHGKPQTEHMHCQSKPAMETPAHGVCVCLIRNCANAKPGARIAALPCGMACMVMVRICHRQIRPSRLGGSSPAP